MPTFSELLTQYIQRTGITDAELARSIGVRRQTIFRWKEGLVERPRHREDVLKLAKRLRLTAIERDGLLIAAGFPPEQMPPEQVSPEQGLSPPTGTADALSAAPTQASDLTQLPDPRAPSPALHASVPTAASQTAPLTLGPQITLDAAESNAEGKSPNATGPVVTAGVATAGLAPEGVDTEGVGAPIWRRWWAQIGSGQTGQTAWRWALPVLGLLALLLGLGWSMNGLSARLTGATSTPVSGSVPVVDLHAPTPPPTATPFRVVAQEGETLLLIATFANYAGNAGFNIAGRIEEALDEQIAQTQLEQIKVVVLEEQIGNAVRADAQLAAANAAILLWGEYDNARVVVNFAVRGDLGNPHIRRDLQSLDELPTVINRDVPQQVRSLALFTLGQLFRGEGQLPQAKMALENALTLDPPDELRSKIYFYLGSVAGQVVEADLEQAIRHYTEAIALRPADANALYNRGLAFWNRYRRYTNTTDDLDSAIADFSQTITLKPSYAKAFLNRGVAYYDHSNFKPTTTTPAGRSDIQRAIADFGRVIQLTPDDYDAYFNRGLAHIRAGDNTLWLADLQKAQELVVPERKRDIYTALCWAYTLAQQPQEALTNCQQAVEMNPERGDNEDSLGIIYAQMGELDKSAAHFSSYVTWLKTQPPAYYNRYRGPLVEGWIAALHQGDNPITAELLETLR